MDKIIIEDINVGPGWVVARWWKGTKGKIHEGFGCVRRIRRKRGGNGIEWTLMLKKSGRSIGLVNTSPEPRQKKTAGEDVAVAHISIFYHNRSDEAPRRQRQRRPCQHHPFVVAHAARWLMSLVVESPWADPCSCLLRVLQHYLRCQVFYRWGQAIFVTQPSASPVFNHLQDQKLGIDFQEGYTVLNPPSRCWLNGFQCTQSTRISGMRGLVTRLEDYFVSLMHTLLLSYPYHFL